MSHTALAALATNVRAEWGAAGDRWLTALPATLAALAAEWELELGDPFPLTYHWVGPATTATGGGNAVLKVGFPGDGHLAVEAAALAAWGGRGAARLLRTDPARGALLLERVTPGTPASPLVPGADERATAAAVTVLRRLHAVPPPADGVPPLETQARAFDEHLRDRGRAALVPFAVVERARALFGELTASAPARVLLHGDLHHDNVLRSERDGWLAIDPHGVTGDPGYDAGAWLYNPQPDRCGDALPRLLAARVEQLADGLAQPAERIVAWGFVKAVLSAVWTASTGVPPGDRSLEVAALLRARLP